MHRASCSAAPARLAGTGSFRCVSGGATSPVHHRQAAASLTHAQLMPGAAHWTGRAAGPPADGSSRLDADSVAGSAQHLHHLGLTGSLGAAGRCQTQRGGLAASLAGQSGRVDPLQPAAARPPHPLAPAVLLRADPAHQGARALADYLRALAGWAPMRHAVRRARRRR